MKDNILFVGDPESQSILDKFQEQNANFCIIKDFRKCGSAVCGWNAKENSEEKTTALRCMLLAKSPIQVVMLGGHEGLSVHSEYSLYTILENGMQGVKMCISGEVPGELIKKHSLQENSEVS